MSFFMKRYPERFANLIGRKADSLGNCSCRQLRWRAAEQQLRCLPGSWTRATADFASFAAPFRSGTATGAHVMQAAGIGLQFATFFCVGIALGRRSIQGYKLQR
mmetsp:Transcript_9502/g.30134  ORF Transcript_9502/g.30134 Transcript_9502/m.30134 type:complete len:104 (-) Transcript_9502:213-524(-)